MCTVMLQVKSALAGYEQVWSQRRRDSSGGSSTQQFAPRVTPSLLTLFANFDCYMVSVYCINYTVQASCSNSSVVPVVSR
jgi:hypothetical protein